ncbi:hypothetical protein OAT36_04645 [Flavobacteriaceae bacterium]|nr:hypothetical protein [Flavobacteriaceae bacterium]
MKSKNPKKDNISDEFTITRKEALKKIGKYGKYTALTALGTFIILHPKKAQASSPNSGLIAPGHEGFFD